MDEKVKEVLETKVKPLLMQDGGDVELVEVTKEGVVKVKLKGACAGCPGASMTLTMVIEQALKQELPNIAKVETVF
jgi:Fe-S cluster biogenesis protein NfuA